MTLNQEEKWLLNEKYQGRESKAFQADLESLRAGEPLAYLIGYVPFLNCRIYLDSHPLVPRPETEYWVEKLLPFIRVKGRSARVLDLCAGSGCVGVVVAKVVSEARVTFAEIDPNHLSTINKNLAHNLTDYSDRSEYLEVIESDLFENISDQFDFILCNPPYIDPAVDRAEASVKAHEPHLALYGGQDGLEIIQRLIAEAPKYLLPQGEVWLEHEPEQSEAIQKGASLEGFHSTTYLDQYGIERFSRILR